MKADIFLDSNREELKYWTVPKGWPVSFEYKNGLVFWGPNPQNKGQRGSNREMMNRKRMRIGHWQGLSWDVHIFLWRLLEFMGFLLCRLCRCFTIASTLIFLAHSFELHFGCVARALRFSISFDKKQKLFWTILDLSFVFLLGSSKNAQGSSSRNDELM